MAIKFIAFLCFLLLANAVSLARCDNGFESCQSVDYDTILAKKPVDQNFRLGPQGFYAMTESGCYVLDVQQLGFDVEHPALSELYNTAKTDLYGKFGNAAVNATASECPDGKFGDAEVKAPAANCYDFCSPNSDSCTDSCTCVLDYTACTFDVCNDVYVCLPAGR